MEPYSLFLGLRQYTARPPVRHPLQRTLAGLFKALNGERKGIGAIGDPRPIGIAATLAAGLNSAPKVKLVDDECDFLFEGLRFCPRTTPNALESSGP